MSHKNDFNVWSKWDPLQKVLIGSCVGPEYFDHVANIEIREKLQKLVIETQEDLDRIADHCMQLGVEVVRTNPNHPNLQKHLHPDQKAQAIGWLLYPRDHLAVLGNQFIASESKMVTNNFYESVIDSKLIHKQTAWYDLLVKNNVKFTDPPCWTLVGKDLFIDVVSYKKLDIDSKVWQNIIEKWSKKWLPEIDIHWVNIGGHNDGCFHTLKPGVIMSVEEIMKYHETFPGWEILWLPDQSWQAIRGFLETKSKHKGKYWIPGEENNNELLDFINTWLNDWLGYVEETVFDVNCLVINESTVLVNNYNKEVFEFFKKHKIEPIICPLRHRYFFDGGIHCVSLDLVRDGQCQSYIDYK